MQYQFYCMFFVSNQTELKRPFRFGLMRFAHILNGHTMMPGLYKKGHNPGFIA